MAAGSIVIDLLMKTGQFETDTKRAEKRLREFEKSVERMAKVAAGAAVAAAGAFAVMAKSAIDNADRLAKLALSTGIATEALSELEYAAKQSGSSSEELSTALSRLNRSSVQAAEGMKAPAEAYAKLGVSVTDAAGRMKDSETILLEVAEAFAGLEDGPQKAALSMEIFGRAGANLIPFLNQGKDGLQALREEARAFGLTVDSEAAASAERFNDNLARLRAAAEGVTNQLVQAMLPAFEELSNAAVDFAKESSAIKILMDAVAAVFETIAVIGVNVAYVFEQVGAELGAMAAQAAALARLDFDAFSFIRDARIEDAVEARRRVDELSASILNARKIAAQGIYGPPLSAMNRGGRVVSPIAPTPAATAGRAGPSEEERRMMDLMREGQALTESMLTPIEKLFQAEMKLEELRKARVITDETYNRALQQARSAYEDTVPSIIKAREEQDRLNQLLAATPTAQLEKTRDDMALLADAFTRGTITATQYFEAVQTRLGTLPEAIEDATSAMDEFAVSAARAIQSGISDALVSLNGDFSDMATNFGKAIQRMIADAVAADLARRLFGDYGSTGSVGGWAGQALSFLGSVFGGGRAGGGDVMPGSAYLVGERGPEMFVPRTAGTVLSNAQTAGVRNEYNISVTVPQGSPQETRRAAATGAREALAFISNAGRYA